MDKPPQQPAQVHHDAGPYYGGDPNQHAYPQNQGGSNAGYYGAPAPGPQQGYGPPQQGGYYGPPQGGMQYGQGPPQQMYVQDSRHGGGGGGGAGCCAGIAAALACCCCLDCLF